MWRAADWESLHVDRKDAAHGDGWMNTPPKEGSYSVSVHPMEKEIKDVSSPRKKH